MRSLQSHEHYTLVKAICEKIIAAGHQALLAGGCVRDGLLDRPPKDLDIATSARPEQIEALFERTEPVGKRFGIIIVIQDGIGFEVATFRKDGEYADGRHPDSVEYSSIDEDAKRRDFTINAMYYDCIAETTIDLVEGQQDLRLRQIRAVGNAAERFAEDHLRILRAIRFASRLEFSIENKTFSAMAQVAPQLTKIAVERVQSEIEQILADKNWLSALELMEQAEISKVLIPNWQLDKIKSASIGMDDMSSDQKWLWIFLLHDLEVKSESKKWRFKKDTVRAWSRALDCFRSLKEMDSREKKLLHLSLVREDYFELFCSNSFRHHIYQHDFSLEDYEWAKSCRNNPLLDGHEVGQFASGAQISVALDIVLMEHIARRISTKSEAIELLKNKPSGGE